MEKSLLRSLGVLAVMVVAAQLYPVVGAAPKAGKGRHVEAASVPTINLLPSADGTPTALGDIVYFETDTSGVRNPRIVVTCIQGGLAVWGDQNAPSAPYLLGGDWSPWRVQGGDAECIAELVELIWHGNRPQQVTVLAETRFTAKG